MAGDAALASRAALEAELATLEAELAQYQQIADEIPAIYEEKFRQQLQQLALELRRLIDEREALQQQITALLPVAGAPPPAAIAPASTGAIPRAPVPSWRFRRPTLSLPWPQRLPPSRWLWSGGAIALAGASALVLWRRVPVPTPVPTSVAAVRPRPPAPAPGQPSRLTLRAEGEAWLELQTLAGERLYAHTLQAGQVVRLPLPGAVRLRSGRPDLLQVSLDGQRFQPLGGVAEVDWHRVNPPAAPASPPAKAS